jgi:hypothetical protein
MVICFNNTSLESIGGEMDTFVGADRIVKESGWRLGYYPLGYLDIIEVINLLHHEFNVEVGTSVIPLHNSNPSAGLCNGARTCKALRCGWKFT